MIQFESIIIPLSAALGLSLVIERILELAKNLLEFLLSRSKGRKIPRVSEPDSLLDDLEKTYEREKTSREVEEQAERIANEREQSKAELERESEQTKRKALMEKLVAPEKDGEWDERFSNATVLVEPATDPDDGKTSKAFILQFLGFTIGIFLVHYSGLQLFNAFLVSLESTLRLEPWFDYLLTGLLIGGGSKPMHILVRFVTQRKILAEGKPISAEEKEKTPSTSEKPSPPVIIPSPPSPIEAEWIDIRYNGGVDREKLEWLHKRKNDPDLVVFHHTTMNNRSTFEDVVRVIKNRKDSKGNHWLTGYNCVVLADGSIHPFCRWDRYGNHAVGYNRRSLGIAFNGNFETDPNVPYSNPDGRFGPTQPSEVQLKAGARVVTLWTLLYSIDLDFKQAIIPHRKISSKVCPGSGFPYDEFMKWVEFYRNHWEKSSAIQEHIDIFKLKPFLYFNKEV